MDTVIGSETEFGIVAVNSDLSPVVTSTQAVIAYAQYSGQEMEHRPRWSYDSESPLRDIRGFDLRRYQQAPELSPHALGAANVVTNSGARLYVDHAHPEYSSPETSNAYEALIWDKAGELIMHRAASVSSQQEGQPTLKIYKNNVDGKGASYGAHENYLYPREQDMESLHQALIPHFVTRQIYTGAGRVGLGPQGEENGFQISQRADYIETEISLETTLNRGIINTRDEPHADSAWRRIHVIIGDATLSEYATFLKFGTTQLLLRAVAAGADFSDLRLYDPVNAVRQVSRDLQCREKIQLYGNRFYSAIEIQHIIRERVTQALSSDKQEHDHHILDIWGEILQDLEDNPLSTADRLDWAAKYSLIAAYRKRGMELTDPRIQLIDIQYHDIDPNKGLYYALLKKGKMKRLITDEQINYAASFPPEDTRAWLRGLFVRKWQQCILAVNWDSVVVDCPHGDHSATLISLDQPSGIITEQLREKANNSQCIQDFIYELSVIMPDSIRGID